MSDVQSCNQRMLKMFNMFYEKCMHIREQAVSAEVNQMFNVFAREWKGCFGMRAVGFIGFLGG